MSAIDKRLYYLMLSPSKGQDFAASGGFSVPSEEVREAETYDIIGRWTIITTAGLLEDIIQTSDWFCELEDMVNVPEEDLDQFRRTLVSHGVALTNKMLDSGKIVIVISPEDLDEDE